jgi:DNA invertase Pin-like site-specific DNA recombinase
MRDEKMRLLRNECVSRALMTTNSDVSFDRCLDKSTESPKVAILCRVSSKRQTVEETIDIQHDQCKQLLARYFPEHQTEEILVYTSLNEGYSLEEKDLRFSFWTVMDLIKRGEVNTIITVHNSRMFRGRNLQVNAEISTILRRHRVTVITMDGRRQVDPTDTTADVVESVYVNLGVAEKKQMTSRLQLSRRWRVRMQGRWRPTVVPYGYDIRVKGSGGSREYVYEIVEQEAQIIRDVFRLYLGLTTEKVPATIGPAPGMNEIANHLNRLGYTRHSWIPRIPPNHRAAKAGATWTGAFISRLMANPMYFGQMVVHFKEPPEDSPYQDAGFVKKIPVPPTVDRELWERAAEIKMVRRARVSLLMDSPAQGLNFLHRLIVCSTCQARLRGQKDTLGHRFYGCWKPREKDEKHRSYRAVDIELIVGHLLQGWMMAGTLLDRLYPEDLDLEAERRELERLERAHNSLKDQLNVLTREYARGEIDLDQYKHVKSEIVKERHVVGARIKQVRAMVGQSCTRELGTLVEGFQERLKSADPPSKAPLLRAAASSLVERIEVEELPELDLQSLTEAELQHHYNRGRITRADLATRWHPTTCHRKFGPSGRRRQPLNYRLHIHWKTGQCCTTDGADEVVASLSREAEGR